MTKQKSVSAVTQVTQFLRVPRFDSIKSRILVLAVVGALLPAGTMLGVAYRQTRNALEDRITDDLVTESSQTARGVNVWLKERLYDLRIFAASEEVVSNLGRSSRQGEGSTRLRDYLRSLHARIPDFEQFYVLDAKGRVLASSGAESRGVKLPGDWQRAFRTAGQAVGDAYWDTRAAKGKMIVAVPVQLAGGQVAGAFAAELSLAPLQATIREFARDTSVNGVYLASDSGHVLARTGEVSRRLLNIRLNPVTMQRLARRENVATTYVNFEGREVLGTLERVPQTQWSVIAEVPIDVTFAEVRNFRNFGLLVGAFVLLIVAWTAYRLGILIVRPLERLAAGASEVARGDLDVDLPDAGGAGEVGVLTTVFNGMVQRLRGGRQQLASANETLRNKNEELERLSVTDGLTGLANHRALMQRLTEEGTRSIRNKRGFAVIMCDVDHFKQFNDEFGHPAGDEVLKLVAGLVRDSTRTVDCAARYGGEEFALLLPETDLAGALEVAERIRSRVERRDFPGRKITVSLGVAEYPKHARTPQEVVAEADAALYEAKRAGRNQVKWAKTSRTPRVPTARQPRSVAVRKKG